MHACGVCFHLFIKLYATQEVAIQGFLPVRIPISANILITITGNNFDIGNSSLSRVEIADTTCMIT